MKEDHLHQEKGKKAIQKSLNNLKEGLALLSLKRLDCIAKWAAPTFLLLFIPLMPQILARYAVIFRFVRILQWNDQSINLKSIIFIDHLWVFSNFFQFYCVLTLLQEDTRLPTGYSSSSSSLPYSTSVISSPYGFSGSHNFTVCGTSNRNTFLHNLITNCLW